MGLQYFILVYVLKRVGKRMLYYVCSVLDAAPAMNSGARDRLWVLYCFDITQIWNFRNRENASVLCVTSDSRDTIFSALGQKVYLVKTCLSLSKQSVFAWMGDVYFRASQDNCRKRFCMSFSAFSAAGWLFQIGVSAYHEHAQWLSQPKIVWGGQDFWLQASNSILFGIPPLKAQND